MALEVIANELTRRHFGIQTQQLLRSMSLECGNIGFHYERMLNVRAKKIELMSPSQKKHALQNGPYVEYFGMSIYNELEEEPSIHILADNYVNSNGVWYKRRVDLSISTRAVDVVLSELASLDFNLGKLFANKWAQNDFEKRHGECSFMVKEYEIDDLNKLIVYMLTKA